MSENPPSKPAAHASTAASSAHLEALKKQRIRSVAAAQTKNFSELFLISGLDPKKHCRFADRSDKSFRQADIRGFDFTGARLNNCDFTGAMIAGAKFEGVELDFVKPFEQENDRRTKLNLASDWRQALTHDHSLQSRRFSDAHLNSGAVFVDSFVGPEMVIVPAGTTLVLLDDQVNPSSVKTVRDQLAHRADSLLEAFEVRQLERPIAVSRFLMNEASLRDFSEFSRVPVGGEFKSFIDSIIAALTAQTGRTYRIIEEYEWEYCCGFPISAETPSHEWISSVQRQFQYGNELSLNICNAFGLFGSTPDWWAEDNEWFSPSDSDGPLLFTKTPTPTYSRTRTSSNSFRVARDLA
jgi:hypothetical protein